MRYGISCATLGEAYKYGLSVTDAGELHLNSFCNGKFAHAWADYHML